MKISHVERRSQRLCPLSNKSKTVVYGELYYCFDGSGDGHRLKTYYTQKPTLYRRE